MVPHLKKKSVIEIIFFVPFLVRLNLGLRNALSGRFEESYSLLRNCYQLFGTSNVRDNSFVALRRG